MARSRGDGNTTAYAVATVLFAILFVFSLILTIVFYSRLGKAESTARGATLALRKFITPDQERQQLVVVLQNQAAAKRESVYKLLQEQISTLKTIVAGSADSADIEAIYEQWEHLVGGQGTPYVAEIQRLKLALKSQEDNIAQMQVDRDAAAQGAIEATEAKARAAIEYKTARERDEQLYNDVRDAYEEQVNAFATKLVRIQDDFGMKLDNTRTTRDKIQLDADEYAAQIRKLLDEIGELQSIVAGRDKPSEAGAVVESDGEIESLVPDEELAYIDLGRLHHVQPGLTFEVYGSNELIKLDRFDELPRGKATIEVIGVQQVSSKARIVRSTIGQPVFDGDKIYNIVFDKDIQPVFYVFGKFDIRGLGQATRTDRRSVETMVQQYNGRLAKKLTYEVDYLVLGTEPAVPRKPSDEEFRDDPKVLERYQHAEKQYNEYQSLIGTARELKIPVLNQNRFLELVGHYQR